MLGFGEYTVPAGSHMKDKDFHSVLSSRMQQGLGEGGKPTRTPHHWEHEDIVSEKSAKVLRKHGFTKKTKHIGEGRYMVRFHKHKLQELNNHLSLMHSAHAIGYHHGEKSK